MKICTSELVTQINQCLATTSTPIHCCIHASIHETLRARFLWGKWLCDKISYSNESINSYLYIGDPKQPNIEDTVSDESSQIQSQKVKVETYNTEKTKGNVQMGKRKDFRKFDKAQLWWLGDLLRASPKLQLLSGVHSVQYLSKVVQGRNSGEPAAKAQWCMWGVKAGLCGQI